MGPPRIPWSSERPVTLVTLRREAGGTERSLDRGVSAGGWWDGAPTRLGVIGGRLSPLQASLPLASVADEAVNRVNDVIEGVV